MTAAGILGEMSEILAAQFCLSNQPFHEMLIPSSSSPGVIYRITVPLPDDAREEWYCSCPGWTFRGTCKHLSMVSPCHWNELGGPEEQTKEQKVNQECPRCHGETYEDLVMT